MAEEHNIPKVYDPASVEKKWYKYWEEHRYFHAEVEASEPEPTAVRTVPMGRDRVAVS